MDSRTWFRYQTNIESIIEEICKEEADREAIIANVREQTLDALNELAPDLVCISPYDEPEDGRYCDGGNCQDCRWAVTPEEYDDIKYGEYE